MKQCFEEAPVVSASLYCLQLVAPISITMNIGARKCVPDLTVEPLSRATRSWKWKRMSISSVLNKYGRQA